MTSSSFFLLFRFIVWKTTTRILLFSPKCPWIPKSHTKIAWFLPATAGQSYKTFGALFLPPPVLWLVHGYCHTPISFTILCWPSWQQTTVWSLAGFRSICWSNFSIVYIVYVLASLKSTLCLVCKKATGMCIFMVDCICYLLVALWNKLLLALIKVRCY